MKKQGDDEHQTTSPGESNLENRFVADIEIGAGMDYGSPARS